MMAYSNDDQGGSSVNLNRSVDSLASKKASKKNLHHQRIQGATKLRISSKQKNFKDAVQKTNSTNDIYRGFESSAKYNRLP